MALLELAGIRVLEALFVLGCAGSALVIVLTSIEDVATVLEKEQGQESENTPLVAAMIDRSDVTA